MLEEVRTHLEGRKAGIRSMVATNPSKAYAELNQIASMLGAKYRVVLQFHFPDAGKIKEVDLYGSENMSVVVDPHRKRFPIARDIIKQKAAEMLGEVETKDAYMYEGKEGLKVFLRDGRIDILPGSLHLWCRIDDGVRRFVDWLMPECYGIR